MSEGETFRTYQTKLEVLSKDYNFYVDSLEKQRNNLLARDRKSVRVIARLKEELRQAKSALGYQDSADANFESEDV